MAEKMHIDLTERAKDIVLKAVGQFPNSECSSTELVNNMIENLESYEIVQITKMVFRSKSGEVKTIKKVKRIIINI